MALELSGEKLLTKGGNVVDAASLLGDKYVGFYFSAHWCPPCRGFTPLLVKFYEDFKLKTDEFEIVFISSDRDEGSFNNYYGTMPWAALPYSQRDKKNALSAKYGVRGIPSLIILDKDGSVITKDGRTRVTSDPQGTEFPWKPLPLSHDLGNSFLFQNGEVSETVLNGKYLGLYFSAHWCGPCRKFTPILVSFYNERKAKGLDDFEIIFISADQDEGSFGEYYGSMPWLAIPFQDTRVSKLSDRFSVSGIPTLVIVDPNGNVITTDGRSKIEADPHGLRFSFH